MRREGVYRVFGEKRAIKLQAASQALCDAAGSNARVVRRRKRFGFWEVDRVTWRKGNL